MAMTMMRAVDASISESESKRRMGLKLLVPLDYFMKDRIIPKVFLRVPNVDEAVSFYKAAFGAEVVTPVVFISSPSMTELTIDYGKFNVVLKECPDISILWLLTFSNVLEYVWPRGGIDDGAIQEKELYVEDVKAAFRRAVSAGAEVLDDVCKFQDDIHMEEVDMACVKDSFGCIWIFKSYPKRRGYFINLLYALLNMY
ncbi:hypothetical protein FNV43_RR08933 [Rhamnella rubrinervis]|uniref:Glyoxalase/fosfomycin resistance/dioxygenase domain-containing protein n=1 Tax=Rhamnella rubrinervis TaxID=2594499 RepID=A0A8K0MJU9_9ROSA|nr:hypothetical protein FNV43_RR08933 [Rhamnella rubrinervis]